MSREVRYDGREAFQIRFPFDRGLVDRIKSLPQRRWNASERFWWVPEADVVPLVDLLEPHGFRFDDATRRAYKELGGTLALESVGVEDPPTPHLPGLFDDAGAASDDEVRSAPPEDYTVSRLNESVRRAIEAAFPQPVWLVGEISGFNRNAHKKHVGFQIDEKDDTGKTVSSVNATLFERTRREIERTLADAGEPFRLEDEVTVRLQVRINLYVPWGSYRVVVERLDVSYTLGEAARRREEILRKLTEEGLIGLNTSLELPALPLSVGLVTSLGSDAYNDVLRTLQESGFAFRVVAHGARVQGQSTESSVLNALDVLRARSDELDVVMICRGGGSRTDLAWFDSAALGRAVARFPLPVLVGIGHEQDRSVLDEVGWRSKTPTAAAAFLVDTVKRGLEAVETRCSELLGHAARRLVDERRRSAERGRRLGLAARALLRREMGELGHRRKRTTLGARSLIAAAGERVTRWIRNIPRAASIHVARQGEFLEHARRSLTQGTRRALRHELERSETRARRLQLVDPRHVLDRGYSILRTDDGRVLVAAEAAPAGTPLTAQLKRGGLKLVSEGNIESGGD